MTSYCPWTRGQAVAGIDVDSGKEVEVALPSSVLPALWPAPVPGWKSAALLMAPKCSPSVGQLSSAPQKSGVCMDGVAGISRPRKPVEYDLLPRQGNNWLKTQIVINGWVVRINDTEL